MGTAPLTQTTGRRKEAVARAQVRPGTGQFLINGKTLEAYFPTAVSQMVVSEALTVTDTRENYDITASIHGGGVSGQAGALRLAIARSLVELDPESRAALKKAGCDLVLVAGRPGEREDALRELGASDFIFVGADVLSVMTRVLDSDGVQR